MSKDGNAQSKTKRSVKEKAKDSIIEAVKFVSPLCDDKSDIARYLTIRDRWLIAYDGITAAGTLIDESMNASPDAALFLAALKAAKAGATLTLDGTVLTVKAGRFSARVPCLPQEAGNPIEPDPQTHFIDDRFKEAFETLSKIVLDGGDEIRSSIAIINDSMYSTNGRVLMQYWHSFELPISVMIPKASARFVASTDKFIVGIGASTNSVTFHFDDGSWVKTNLYNKQPPDYNRILTPEAPLSVKEIPEELWTGLSALKKFCSDDRIYVYNKGLRTHFKQNLSSVYEFEGLEGLEEFEVDQLQSFESLFTHIDMTSSSRVIYLFGNAHNVRGCISKFPKETEEDIPF